MLPARWMQAFIEALLTHTQGLLKLTLRWTGTSAWTVPRPSDRFLGKANESLSGAGLTDRSWLSPISQISSTGASTTERQSDRQEQTGSGFRDRVSRLPVST